MLVASSLHVAPVGAYFGVGYQRDREPVNTFHHFFGQLGEPGNFILGAFEEQLVVNLQYHLRLEIFRRQTAIEFNHRQLDQVGGGALHGRVHGGALGKIAQVGLRRIDFGDLAHAAEERARDAGLARPCDLPVQEILNSAVALEILGDELRGFLLIDAELLGQAKRRQPVNHAEINNFRDAAMFARLRKRGDVENFLRGARVNVLPATKGFDEYRVAREMRENAQLDLRIIRGKKTASRRGDERGANFTAQLRANGNILQIWSRRAEASGRGAGLTEARVQPAGYGMDQPRQHVGISGFE